MVIKILVIYSKHRTSGIPPIYWFYFINFFQKQHGRCALYMRLIKSIQDSKKYIDTCLFTELFKNGEVYYKNVWERIDPAHTLISIFAYISNINYFALIHSFWIHSFGVKNQYMQHAIVVGFMNLNTVATKPVVWFVAVLTISNKYPQQKYWFVKKCFIIIFLAHPYKNRAIVQHIWNDHQMEALIQTNLIINSESELYVKHIYNYKQ